MKIKCVAVVAAIALLAIVSMNSPVSASNRDGGKCSKVGAKTKSGPSITLICTKVGKTLKWKKLPSSTSKCGSSAPGAFTHAPFNAADVAIITNGFSFFRIKESDFYIDKEGSLEKLWPLLAELEKDSGHLKVKGDESRDANDEEHLTPDVEKKVEAINKNQLSKHEDQDFKIQVREPVYDNETGPIIQVFERDQLAKTLGREEYPPDSSARSRLLKSYWSWAPVAGKSYGRIADDSANIPLNLMEIVGVEGPILGSYLIRQHYRATGGWSLSSQSEHRYFRQLKMLLDRNEIISFDQSLGRSIADAT